MATIMADFCARLLALDSGIRFVGVASKDAELVACVYRKDVVPLLTPEETGISIFGAIFRTQTRSVLERKLGRTVYSVTVYKKVKRATIPIYDTEGQTLLVSFDVDVDHESVIRKKILPELER